jgi:hypothetical protein
MNLTNDIISDEWADDQYERKTPNYSVEIDPLCPSPARFPQTALKDCG